MLTDISMAHVLHSDVMNLPAKEAVETVPPAYRESGFYSHYFLLPKKDGGLRLILDLRQLNHALMKQPFKIETNPLAGLPRGLVLLSGSERCLLSYPESPPITDHFLD